MVNPKINRKIFKIILKEPVSLYEINKEIGGSIGKGTISKILKKFKNDGLIEPYDVKKEKDEQKLQRWGPTILGISELYLSDPSLQEKLGNIFDRWKVYPEFQKRLEKMGFSNTMIKNQTKKTRNIFEKYIKYLDGVRKQVIKLLDEPNSFDTLTLFSIGEFLFLQNSENQKMFKELYAAMPGVQKNVDVTFKNLKTSYRRFKQEIVKK